VKITSFSLPNDSRWASLGAIAARSMKCAGCSREVTLETVGVIFSDSSYLQQDAHFCEGCALTITKAGKA
jgi:hypothetical protein